MFPDYWQQQQNIRISLQCHQFNLFHHPCYMTYPNHCMYMYTIFVKNITHI